MKTWSWLLLVAALGLGACSNAVEEEAEPAAELEAALQQKTEELRKARERYDRQLTEFTASVRERHARKIEQLELRMKAEEESFTRTIQSLQARLDAAENALVQRKPEPAPAAVPPPPPLAPAPPRIITRSATVAAEYTVEVTDVSGEHAVIGSHPTTRMVETDETFRDAFGDLKTRMRPETVDIPEYGYRASATLSNTGGVSVAVWLRCGQGEQRLQLGPGEERRVEVDSARGAPLVVRVNGRTRSFDVTYP